MMKSIKNAFSQLVNGREEEDAYVRMFMIEYPREYHYFMKMNMPVTKHTVVGYLNNLRSSK